MDKSSSDDIPRFDGEHLQLPADVSSSTIRADSYVVERRDDHWISISETDSVVNSIYGVETSRLPTSSTGLPQVVDRGSPSNEPIPQFYFENGPPLDNAFRELYLSLIDYSFDGHTNGLRKDEFKLVTTKICKLPSFFSIALFQKIDEDATGLVSREAFINYWIHRRMCMIDETTHVYTILKKPNAKYLTKHDFVPVIQQSLVTRRGLEFLSSPPSPPQALDRYVETIIHRIFYYINRSGNGRLTLGEMKQSDLIPAMLDVDEKDIAEVKYFSYRDFYVIYCKFWELDTDHDLLIDERTLTKYDDHALSFTIIDRIFAEAPRKLTSGIEGNMIYEDFVYFILAEENKSAEPSLEYWFKCIDIDENGVITPDDMKWFYEEQVTRLEEMDTHTTYTFEDVLCEIIDMINPENERYITLSDIKRSKLSHKAFNMLFNARKYLVYEARNTTEKRQDRLYSDWDSFVSREYGKLFKKANNIESSGSNIGSSGSNSELLTVRTGNIPGISHECPF